MKRREQALLFLRKAAQDESLLDAVLESHNVSDEVIGFHCQQAAEKMLKALLSDLGAAFHKTHELGRLMAVEDRLRMRSLSQPT
jgi:HEPN domain-containing protein